MANPLFPVLSLGQDSQFYTVEQENPVLATTMEGGYVVTRAKHTRIPRRTFSTGFTDLTDADRVALQAFWETVKGGSVIFDWVNPTDGATYSVRFADKDALSFKYAGMGYTRKWNVQFKLQQA